MTASTNRTIKQGIVGGLLAGIIFMFAEILAAASMGDAALTPFPMFASIVVGADAFDELSIATSVLLGTLVHLGLSATFGLVYGLLASRGTDELRTSWRRHSLLGAAYGCVLWLVNFQVIARIAYPWFADTNPVTQLILHALFFGLPLGLLFVAAEQRAWAEGVPEPA